RNGDQDLERFSNSERELMNRAQAIHFVNTLSSKHQSLQPLLRKFARGEAVTEDELLAAETNDSRAGGVVAALRCVKNGEPKQTTHATEDLDSFGSPLRPLLEALAAGLSD